MIGLQRGCVALVDHQDEWAEIAAKTLRELSETLDGVALAIQHIGSTSIRHIKAKPIIDIAVGVRSLQDVSDFLPRLAQHGYQRSHQRFSDDLLYVAQDAANIRTHQIHILRYGCRQWHNDIDFRDYLNAFPEKAKVYEALKIRLAAECGNIQTAYTDGKKAYMEKTLPDARIYAEMRRRFDVTGFEPIEKGWSCDKKYRLTISDGVSYLLRVTPREQSATRKTMVDLMRRVAKLGVPICQVIEYGMCEEGAYCLQRWIEGRDASDALPDMTDARQYAYGLDAGKILQMMHTLPAPETQEDWAARFNRKIDQKLQLYADCALQYENGQAFLAYISANRHLLQNRPQVFQHGDYHIGNMMIDTDGTLQIIDFDRCDFGDPWEEFNRIVWYAQSSAPFASGMVNGYFDGDVPMKFWRLLALYIALHTLSALPGAIPFGQGEIDTMRCQAREVLSWYNDMQNPVPTWYLSDYHVAFRDGLPFKRKAPFAFDFLAKYGRVFQVFDDQDSGNLCFGCERDGARYFIKFAGAPTQSYQGTQEDAIARLQATFPIYRALHHPNLIEFVGAEKIGGGFAMIFAWTDGVCMGRQYPAAHQKFMQADIPTRLDVFRDILSFFAYVAIQGYVAVDFYDGSILYDFHNRKTMICDIDFFRKAPCVNDMGRMWGSSRFMSPEEFALGATLDEITNVYTLGATAFALFADCDRRRDSWTLHDKTYAVAAKAVRDSRAERQRSVRDFIGEWKTALCQ